MGKLLGLIGATTLVLAMAIGASLLLHPVNVEARSTEENAVGRYQLFQGTYAVVDAKSNRTNSGTAVFLLDTATGNVRKYSTGLYRDGQLFEQWDPTSIPTPRIGQRAGDQQSPP